MTVNGSTVIIDFDGTLIPCLTDSRTINFERDMIETTCIDSTDSWKTFIPGEKGASFDATLNLDWANASGISDLFSKFDGGTLVAFKWGDITTQGEGHFTGSAYVSNLTPDAPQNDKGTASFTCTVTGAVTYVTNP